MYFRIHSENNCVNSTDMFTLGVSTSRGTDKIGQFGSGCLMAVLTWLRIFGESPIFFVNGQKIKFSFCPEKMSNGGQFNRVFIHEGRKKTPLTVALEHGEIDWKESYMALREWISNAIDNGSDISSEDCLSVCSKMEKTESGVTVYVPMNKDVSSYWSSISDYFLHFSGSENDKVLWKPCPSPCRVYRRGVYIRTLDNVSWADYNMDFDISENRNGSSDSMIDNIFTHIGYYLGVEEGRKLFQKVLFGEDSMEKEWPSWRSIRGEFWKEVFEESNHIFVPEGVQDHIDNTAMCVPMKWYNAIINKCPEKDGLAHVSRALTEGLIVSEPDELATRNLDNIWSALELIGLTNNKSRPKLEMFDTKDGKKPMALGLYTKKNETVSIWKEHRMSTSTMIHEVAHHISGAEDCTRDFQDVAFRIAAALIDNF